MTDQSEIERLAAALRCEAEESDVDWLRREVDELDDLQPTADEGAIAQRIAERLGIDEVHTLSSPPEEEAGVELTLREARHINSTSEELSLAGRIASRLRMKDIQPSSVGVKRLPLHEGIQTIGRLPECDVHLPHLSVSRAHATLFISCFGVHVIDSGSRNGTFVNGRSVNGGPVSIHDSVRFGRVEAKLAALLNGTSVSLELVVELPEADEGHEELTRGAVPGSMRLLAGRVETIGGGHCDDTHPFASPVPKSATPISPLSDSNKLSGIAWLMSLLNDDTTRRIAVLAIERFSTREIAQELDLQVSTVRRKLHMITRIWSHTFDRDKL
ncbi:FHA domain-containing protein [Planctomyces sp. SH-PL14]|uniref:FHA domain-containing protein n=1 Tax=Planctomyces sp. SH-PL14 TaxID=1632864 RepID=UPI00078C7C1A|nr:FHA domain-containing protein [Planctomyces sp. SH-PL14]AMV22408.1 Glycogen accumulation regulator GarA [Planctomyces sp. SH-PL14]